MYLTFIDTKLEEELGIGESWNRGEIKFGNCISRQHWDFENQTEFLSLSMDYKFIVARFNKIAKEHNKGSP
jgi:hypothetical protein